MTTTTATGTPQASELDPDALALLGMDEPSSPDSIPVTEVSAPEAEELFPGFTEEPYIRKRLKSRAKYIDMIREAAKQGGMPPNLAAAQLYRESAYRPKALSAQEARGLGQMLPSTARAYGLTVQGTFKKGAKGKKHEWVLKKGEVDERVVPEKAIPAAVRYMTDLKKQMEAAFPGKTEQRYWELAIKAYHAGPRNVKKYKDGEYPGPKNKRYLNTIKEWTQAGYGAATSTAATEATAEVAALLGLDEEPLVSEAAATEASDDVAALLGLDGDVSLTATVPEGLPLPAPVLTSTPAEPEVSINPAPETFREDLSRLLGSVGTATVTIKPKVDRRTGKPRPGMTYQGPTIHTAQSTRSVTNPNMVERVIDVARKNLSEMFTRSPGWITNDIGKVSKAITEATRGGFKDYAYEQAELLENVEANIKRFSASIGENISQLSQVAESNEPPQIARPDGTLVDNPNYVSEETKEVARSLAADLEVALRISSVGDKPETPFLSSSIRKKSMAPDHPLAKALDLDRSDEHWEKAGERLERVGASFREDVSYGVAKIFQVLDISHAAARAITAPILLDDTSMGEAWDTDAGRWTQKVRDSASNGNPAAQALFYMTRYLGLVAGGAQIGTGVVALGVVVNAARAVNAKWEGKPFQEDVLPTYDNVVKTITETSQDAGNMWMILLTDPITYFTFAQKYGAKAIAASTRKLLRASKLPPAEAAALADKLTDASVAARSPEVYRAAVKTEDYAAMARRLKKEGILPKDLKLFDETRGLTPEAFEAVDAAVRLRAPARAAGQRPLRSASAFGDLAPGGSRTKGVGTEMRKDWVRAGPDGAYYPKGYAQTARKLQQAGVPLEDIKNVWGPHGEFFGSAQLTVASPLRIVNLKQLPQPVRGAARLLRKLAVKTQAGAKIDAAMVAKSKAAIAMMRRYKAAVRVAAEGMTPQAAWNAYNKARVLGDMLPHYGARRRILQATDDEVLGRVLPQAVKRWVPGTKEHFVGRLTKTEERASRVTSKKMKSKLAAAYNAVLKATPESAIDDPVLRNRILRSEVDPQFQVRELSEDAVKAYAGQSGQTRRQSAHALLDEGERLKVVYETEKGNRHFEPDWENLQKNPKTARPGELTLFDIGEQLGVITSKNRKAYLRKNREELGRELSEKWTKDFNTKVAFTQKVEKKFYAVSKDPNSIHIDIDEVPRGREWVAAINDFFRLARKEAVEAGVFGEDQFAHNWYTGEYYPRNYEDAFKVLDDVLEGVARQPGVEGPFGSRAAGAVKYQETTLVGDQLVTSRPESRVLQGAGRPLGTPSSKRRPMPVQMPRLRKLAKPEGREQAREAVTDYFHRDEWMRSNADPNVVIPRYMSTLTKAITKKKTLDALAETIGVEVFETAGGLKRTIGFDDLPDTAAGIAAKGEGWSVEGERMYRGLRDTSWGVKNFSEYTTSDGKTFLVPAHAIKRISKELGPGLSADRIVTAIAKATPGLNEKDPMVRMGVDLARWWQGRMSNLFKTTALFWRPAYFGVNITNDVHQLSTLGMSAEDIASLKWVFEADRLLDPNKLAKYSLDVPGAGKVGGSEILESAQSNGISLGTLDSTYQIDVDVMTDRQIKDMIHMLQKGETPGTGIFRKAKPSEKGPAGLMRWGLKTGERANVAWTDRAQMAGFLFRLSKGDTPAEAARAAYSAVMDYGHRSSFIQLLANSMPFIKWAALAPVMTAKSTMRDPLRVMLLHRFMQAAQAGEETRTGEETHQPPKYLAERGASYRLPGYAADLYYGARQLAGGAPQRPGEQLRTLTRDPFAESTEMPYRLIAKQDPEALALSMGPLSKHFAEGFALKTEGKPYDILTKRPFELGEWHEPLTYKASEGLPLPEFARRPFRLLEADVGEQGYFSKYYQTSAGVPAFAIWMQNKLALERGHPWTVAGSMRPLAKDPETKLSHQLLNMVLPWSTYSLTPGGAAMDRIYRLDPAGRKVTHEQKRMMESIRAKQDTGK